MNLKKSKLTNFYSILNVFSLIIKHYYKNNKNRFALKTPRKKTNEPKQPDTKTMPTAAVTQAVEMQIDDDDDNQMDYEIIEIKKVRAANESVSGNNSSNSGISALDDMDVDTMNQIDIDTNELRLIACLDTNIFVSNLADLEHVVAVNDKNRILFMVPWIVLQELDGLKLNTKVGLKAKKAIHFIHSVLSSKTHLNFVFESPIQVDNLLWNCAIGFISETEI